jgi:hypothetical protein
MELCHTSVILWGLGVVILCDSILMVSTAFRMQRYSHVDSWVVFLACVPIFWLSWNINLGALLIRMKRDGQHDIEAHVHSRSWAIVAVMVLIFTTLLRSVFIINDKRRDDVTGRGLGPVSHDWENILCGIAGMLALTISLGYMCRYDILTQSSSTVLSSIMHVKGVLTTVAVCFQLLALGLFCAMWDNNAIQRRNEWKSENEGVDEEVVDYVHWELVSITYVIIASLVGAVFLGVKNGITSKIYLRLSCSFVGLINIVALYTLPYHTNHCMHATNRVACAHDEIFYMLIAAAISIGCVFMFVIYCAIR